MGYTLEAVLGSPAVIRAVVADLPAATWIPLSEDIAMVPMTDDLFDSATVDVATHRNLGFEMLPGGFTDRLSSWSTIAPVGYVEAEFFGGVGSQRAALWTDGELTLGPVSVDEDQPFSTDGSPISQILRRLGVRRGRHHDEFDALGLDRRRHTEEWLTDPAPG